MRWPSVWQPSSPFCENNLPFFAAISGAGLIQPETIVSVLTYWPLVSIVFLFVLPSLITQFNRCTGHKSAYHRLLCCFPFYSPQVYNSTSPLVLSLRSFHLSLYTLIPPTTLWCYVSDWIIASISQGPKKVSFLLFHFLFCLSPTKCY